MSTGPGYIGDFTGEYGYLSNFHVAPIVIDGVTYPSGEHAFNAAKTLDPTERARVLAAPTPSKAKMAGRRVTLREEWDDRVRYRIMDRVVAEKFAPGTDLAARLLATGDALLVEHTTWHDQHWGDCRCEKHFAWPGANHLGRALMDHRAALRSDTPERWVRVAVTGHRPQHLRPEQQAFARAELARLAAKVRDQHGTTVAISGMALGADTWWAQAALAAGIDLWAYIPFEVQGGRWRERDQAVWSDLRARAARELVLATNYDVRLLHARNEYMIRDADVLIAIHDPAKTTGGTASAISKARSSGKTLILTDVVSRRTAISRPVS